MTEARKTKNSCFLIALDPEEGHNGVTSLTQDCRNIKVPLLKSKSYNLKQKEESLLNESQEWDEDDEMESMSIMEESYSCVTQSNMGMGFMTPGSKPRKSGKKYNRKEKSLGELCKKFIYLYGSQKYCIIALDEWTYTLGVERRRIYDIINILESFNVLSRLAKNQYEWRGVSQIKNSIDRMKDSSSDEFASSPLKKRKKKKSLGILWESFICQFLKWRSTISLEQAARRISDNHIDESKLKTKVRRLYDIANVLAALNLIEKTSLDTRKPAFKWVGEVGLHRFIHEMEQYFKDHKMEDGVPNLINIPKANSVDFKTPEMHLRKTTSVTKHFERLDSASTNTTFKNVGSFEIDNDQEMVNSSRNFASNQSFDLQNTSPLAKATQVDLTEQLVELLEKLSMSQRGYPVYKPTPIYPINHFLTNSYSVSAIYLIKFRISERQCWIKFEKTYLKNIRKTKLILLLKQNTKLQSLVKSQKAALSLRPHLNLKLKILNWNRTENKLERTWNSSGAKWWRSLNRALRSSCQVVA